MAQDPAEASAILVRPGSRLCGEKMGWSPSMTAQQPESTCWAVCPHSQAGALGWNKGRLADRGGGTHGMGRGRLRGLPDLTVMQAEVSSLSSSVLHLEVHLGICEEQEEARSQSGGWGDFFLFDILYYVTKKGHN